MTELLYKELTFAVIPIFSSQHQAQAMHYLAGAGCRLALLLNFSTGSLEHRRIIK